MEQEILEEIQGLIADINPTEIVSHFSNGTLIPWLMNLRIKANILVDFLLESENPKLSEKDEK